MSTGVLPSGVVTFLFPDVEGSARRWERAAYDWFNVEVANLRTAFRCATDQGDLDIAATIATYAAFLGFLAENYEPITWVEEIIEPARVVEHPRLAFAYLLASLCWVVGRIEDAVGYGDAGQVAIDNDSGEMTFWMQGWLGSA